MNNSREIILIINACRCEDGREEGKMEAKRENAISLAELGMPIEQIAQVVKENVSLVQKWIAEGMALAK